jgi:hypothetical protein
MRKSLLKLSLHLCIVLLISKISCGDYHEGHQSSHSKSIKKTAKFNFKINWFTASPDGVERKILGANGAFPPILRVKAGE